MERLLVCIILLELIPITGFCFREADIIKNLVLSVSVFLTVYAVVSGLFFMADQFSFVHVLGAMLLLSAPFTGYCVIRLGKVSGWIRPCPYRRFLLLSALILGTVFLSFSKFELFDTGQDPGLYQAEAIELYMGNFEVEHDFEEYQILEKEEDRESYFRMLDDGIPGYYPLAAGGTYMDPFSEEERKSDVSGMYHGVQTFPALLALGGKLFGFENMMQIQTVFLTCSVLLLYFTLCSLQVPLRFSLPSLAVFLISPLVLWVSKSSLTEMVLTMFLSLYLFLLTEADTGIKRLLSALPLVGFAFVHVSFLLLYPVFAGINMLLYLKRRCREYLAANVIASAGLCLGYFMMSRIAPRYFYDNCARLYIGKLITADNFLIWVFAGALFVCAVSEALSGVKKPEAADRVFAAAERFLPVVVLVLLGICLCFVIVPGYFREPDENWFTSYYGQGFAGAFFHSALYTFALATGFAAFAVLPAALIFRCRIFFEDTVELCIAVLFVYCILFQSAFIRKEVYYYYYYSRYLAFYIPIVSAALAIVLKRLRNLKKRIVWTVFLVSFGSMLAFDVPLPVNKDETYLEWETLMDLKAQIKEDSAVILGTEAAKLLGTQMRALTGAAIFPVFEDVSNELSLLLGHYSRVYYIPDDPGRPGDGFNPDDFVVKYRDTYLHWDGAEPGSVPLGLFPVDFHRTRRELALYQLKFISSLDPARMTETPYDALEGYYDLEGTMVWVSRDSSVLLFDDGIKTEGLEIEFVIPDQVAGQGQEKFIDIMVNGKKIGEVPAGTAGSRKVILEPRELPDGDGGYRVELHSPDSFVPAETGMNEDIRELALQVMYIGRVRELFCLNAG